MLLVGDDFAARTVYFRGMLIVTAVAGTGRARLGFRRSVSGKYPETKEYRRVLRVVSSSERHAASLSLPVGAVWAAGSETSDGTE